MMNAGGEAGIERVRLGQELDEPARTVFAAAVNLLVSERYDQRIMSNLIRPDYVEFMVAAALKGGWNIVSADWSGWDLQHDDGARIEVKQSAARQTWTGRQSLDGRAPRGSFDVRQRTGYYTDHGAKWLAYEGRAADLFIFAWHPVTDLVHADHRDPWQWKFYIVLERELPAQKTIGLSTIERQWRAVGYDDLAGAVNAAIFAIPNLKATSAG